MIAITLCHHKAGSENLVYAQTPSQGWVEENNIMHWASAFKDEYTQCLHRQSCEVHCILLGFCVLITLAMVRVYTVYCSAVNSGKMHLVGFLCTVQCDVY